MYFKQFHIQNFQSHKDTTIQFSTGLNIIVGPTNVGKSSILRALRKLIRDEPAGKSFISKWTNTVELSLLVEVNGVAHTIIRKVSPSQNLYYLDDQEFGGFGKTGIPKEIQDALNMKLVELEEGNEIDLHFSDQHDVPFMVSKGSAGTRSKLLGAVAGLCILDRAITRINSDIRAGNNDIKHRCDEISSFEAEIDDFPTLWYEMELITALNDRITAVKVQETTKNAISQEYTKVIKTGSTITDTQALLNSIPDIQFDSTLTAQKIQQLNDIINIDTALDAYDSDIRKLESTLPPEITENIIDIKCKIELLSKINALYSNLMKVSKDAENTKKEGDVEVQLKGYIKEHKEILDELGICPTCERPLK